MERDENNFTNYSGENIEKRKELFNAALLEGTSPGYTSPLINSLRGLRILGKGPAMMPMADNTIGLALVTRPQLNLTDDNISRSEKLVSLYGAGQYSMSGYIRGMLDERWAASNPNVALDNFSPFITCLTEYLKTSSGFGDLQIQVETSDPGLRQQVYQRVASKLEDNSAFTINQTYFNPKPNVLQGLFQIWEDYISEVTSGDRLVTPRDNYLMGNKIDYDCRIYHLIMNKDTEYLEHIFATVQSIPVTYPVGAMANIDNSGSSLRGEGQDDFTIQFASVGMRFDEWGLIQSFNEHTFLYNPRLRPESRNSYFRELKSEEYIPYNYGAYPLLLPRQAEVKGEAGFSTMRTGIKLTWWVPKGREAPNFNQ